MTQEWGSPAPGSEAFAPPAGYALRPLTTGELLDRVFTVFRAHFWLFAGLAAVGGGWNVVLQGLQLLVHHLLLVHYGFVVAKTEGQIAPLLTLPLILLVAAVAYAGSVYAIGEVYLGRTITAAAALRIVRGHWLRYIGILLWHYWSAVWLPLLLVAPGFVMILTIKTPMMIGLGALLIVMGIFGCGVYGVIAFLRNALALPASIVEGGGVRASMRRSKDLANGAKGKLFVVLLIAYALFLVAGMIDFPLLLLIGRSPLQEHVVAQAVILLVGFLVNTLVTPVIVIGYALVYFDQRVRKEGFDLLMLMGTPVSAPVAFPGLEPVPVEVPAQYVATSFETPATQTTAVQPAAEGAELPLDPADPIGDDGRF